jgi:hypothetical protein
LSWRLILLLVGFGPILGWLWQQGIVAAGVVLAALFVIVPVACASWIATGASQRHFRHGFVLGFLLWTLFWLTAISDRNRLVANNPHLGRDPDFVAVGLLLMPVYGSLLGGWLGLLSMLAAAGARNDWYWFREAWRWRLLACLFGFGPLAGMLAYAAQAPPPPQGPADQPPPAFVVYMVFHVAGLVVGGLVARRLGRRPAPWVVGGLLSAGIAIGVLGLLRAEAAAPRNVNPKA